jgi:hypothetical protein
MHPNLIKSYLHLPIIHLVRHQIHTAHPLIIITINIIALLSKYWLIAELLNVADLVMLREAVITISFVDCNLELYALILPRDVHHS